VTYALNHQLLHNQQMRAVTLLADVKKWKLEGGKKKDLYLRTSDIELCTIQILRHRLRIILMTSVTVKK